MPNSGVTETTVNEHDGDDDHGDDDDDGGESTS